MKRNIRRALYSFVAVLVATPGILVFIRYPKQTYLEILVGLWEYYFVLVLVLVLVGYLLTRNEK